MKPSFVPLALGSLLLLAGAAAAQEPAPATPPTLEEKAAPAAADDLAVRLRALSGRPGGLLSDDVGRRAVKNSKDVRAKQAEIAAASAEVDKAFAGWFPKLTLTARYTHLSPVESKGAGPSNVSLVATPSPAGPLPPGAPLIAIPTSALAPPVIQDQYALQAALLLPVSDYFLRISQSQAAADHGRGAADLTHRASKLNAATDAKLIYYGWARAKLSHEVAKQSLVQSKSHHQAAKVLFEVDRASKADVLRAESAVASAELLVERTSNLTELAEDRLRTVLADPPSTRYEIGEDLWGQAPRSTERLDFGPLYAEALKQRLELRALEKSGMSLAEQKRAVKSVGLPRLDAFGNAYYSNPNQRYYPATKEWKATWDVGLQVSWTPNDFLTSTATAAGLEAQRAKLDAQRDQLRDVLRTEVFDAAQSLREAQVALKTAERGASAAEEAYRARAEQYRLGRASSVELTDAEADLSRSRLEVINARVGLRIARVKLDHAVGRDAR
ncbi:MAG: TolC family protein [Polyangiaceae bacterium]|nr:TolC family protein [Polyangiaceae bacterium]